MTRYTIKHVIKALKTAFPGVEFTYASGGQGKRKAVTVSWTGGPAEADVSAASPAHWLGVYRNWRNIYFIRRNTPEEQAVEDARRDADPGVWGSAAWVADTANREAREAAAAVERRKAGAAKAAETRRQRAEIKVALAAFPGIEFEFDVAGRRVEWTSGPPAADVQAKLPAGITARRQTSPEEWAEEAAAKRAAEAAEKHASLDAERNARKARIEAGRSRARLAARQMALPMDLPAENLVRGQKLFRRSSRAWFKSAAIRAVRTGVFE